MEILQVLWEQGPSYTRDIVDALNKGRRKKIAYNSVQTILTIMFNKGLLERDETERSHRYVPAYTQDDIETQFIERLTHKVFEGSTMRLVTRALSASTASADDVQKITQLLKKLESER
jgi:BlaI family transcriptional regulator, penicillinase repressor